MIPPASQHPSTPTSAAKAPGARPRRRGVVRGAGYDAAAGRGRTRATSSSRRRVAGAAVVGALVLTGCGSTVTVDGAPDNTNPDCASVMLAMPESVSGMDQRETSSQGTTAYGDPSAMIVRCGAEEPGPTTDPCTNVNGVDWLISEVPDQKDQWRAVTYGRSPAVEVLFDSSRVPSSTALVDTGSAMQNIEQTRQCLSVKDTLEQQGHP